MTLTGEQLAYDTSALPTIMMFVGAVKAKLPDRWKFVLPMISIALAIAYYVALRPGCKQTAECVFAGLQLGLAATGLHSSLKNATEAGHTGA